MRAARHGLVAARADGQRRGAQPGAGACRSTSLKEGGVREPAPAKPSRDVAQMVTVAFSHAGADGTGCEGGCALSRSHASFPCGRRQRAAQATARRDAQEPAWQWGDVAGTGMASKPHLFIAHYWSEQLAGEPLGLLDPARLPAGLRALSISSCPSYIASPDAPEPAVFEPFGFQTISVLFSPEYQSLSFHYVRVIRNGVVLNRLKLNEIVVIHEENDVDKYQYNGRKRAFIILKDIRKDDRIEAAYSLTGFNPVFANKFTADISFVNDNPILNYYQTVIAESTRQLRFTYYKDCPKPQELIAGDSKIYHWNNATINLWESVSGSPSWFDPYPYVTISEFGNWKQVVDWGLNIYNNYNFELPATLKTRISEWRKRSNGDDNEFIRVALRFVQDDIRYLGLEIGVNTHKPHNPAEVLRNAYGDCKDKALLLATILRSENINAYAALVNTNLRGDLIKRAPSPNEFDHVIVGIENQGALNMLIQQCRSKRGKTLRHLHSCLSICTVVEKRRNQTAIYHASEQQYCTLL